MLRVLSFLIIFGPRLNSGIDVIPVSCLIAVAASLCQPKAHRIPDSLWRSAAIASGALSLLAAHAALHFLNTSDPDSYQTLRFGRIVLNLLGVVALLSMYIRKHGAQAKRVIARDVLDCLVIHAGIMFLMLISPQFRDAINSFVALGDDIGTQISKSSGTRISGLALSWDALSGLQSMGLLMLPLMLTREGISPLYTAIAVPLLVFAVCISGRTGIVTTGVLLPVAIYFSDHKRLRRGAVISCFLLFSFVALALGPFYEHLVRATQDTAIARVIVMFDPSQGNDREANDFAMTIEVIGQHYFLPERFDVLLWGTGRSGRDATYYVAADNGIVLNLHNLGLVAWFVMYGLAMYFVWQGWKLRVLEPAAAAYCVLCVLLIVVIDAKISFLYARNGFSVMMMLVGITWWREPARVAVQPASQRCYRTVPLASLRAA